MNEDLDWKNSRLNFKNSYKITDPLIFESYIC